MPAEHDKAEEIENDTRRDDVLERQFMSGQDRDAGEYDLRRRMAEATFQQQSETWNERQRARDAQSAISRKEAEAYSGLTFRDASAHSTAIAGLEAENSTVGQALEEGVNDDETDPKASE